jgi:hypothetical protein
LKKVKARAERGRGKETSAGVARPPKFRRTTSGAVFGRQFETVAEHNCWSRLEKSRYLITLQGWATDVLYGVPKGATFEEAIKAMEGHFGDQLLAAAYRSQLKTRTQGVGESF